MKPLTMPAGKEKAAPRTGRPSRKAQIDTESYTGNIPHLAYLSTRYINEGKAIRIATRSLSIALDQLEGRTA